MAGVGCQQVRMTVITFGLPGYRWERQALCWDGKSGEWASVCVWTSEGSDGISSTTSISQTLANSDQAREVGTIKYFALLWQGLIARGIWLTTLKAYEGDLNSSAQTRVSHPWHYWQFWTKNSLLVWGAVWCTAECWAVFLASTHWMPTVPIPQ